MTLILYELRKLVGTRHVVIAVSLLLAVNAALCFFSASRTLEYSIPPDTVEEFFELYISDTQGLEEEYASLTAQREEYNKLWMEAMSRGEMDYQPPSLPSKYISDPRFNDLILFGEVFTRRDAILSYPSDIQKVIDRAYANLAEFDAMNIPSDSYAYQYQFTVIDKYKNAQSEVRMGLEYTRGWGDYFSWEAVNIFIFASLLVACCSVFPQERQSGFLGIIRTTRHGRGRTAVSKLCAIVIFTAGVVLLFIFSTWAVFGMRLGYSSPSNAIQAFGAFRMSPDIISVGQYFSISIAVKLLAFTLFSSVVVLISAAVGSYAVIYLSGLGVYGVNFLLYTLRYIDADSILKNLNLVAVSAVNGLFARYRSINIFGSVCGMLLSMLVVYVVLTAVVFIAAAYIYVSGSSATRSAPHLSAFIKKINSGWGILCDRISNISVLRGKHRNYSLSPTRAEVYKTLISSRYILIILVLFALKVYISNDTLGWQASYPDEVYKEYMMVLEGELTDEKREYIDTERAFINDVLSRDQQMKFAYISEEISYGEYRDYLDDLNYVQSRNEIFAGIEEQEAYIESTAFEKGINAHFLYNTGWKRLLHSSFDWTLYAALLLLFSGLFAGEYSSRSSSGGFIYILRTAKNGRGSTFKAKFMSTIFISGILDVIWNTINFLIIIKGYLLPDAGAPMLSVQTFANLDGGISIAEYIVLFAVLHIFAAVLFGIVTGGVSELLRTNVSAMGAVSAIALFPALLSFFGLGFFKYMDFTSLASSTPLVILSAGADLAGDWGLLTLFVSVCAAVSTVLGIRAYRTYTRCRRYTYRY